MRVSTALLMISLTVWYAKTAEVQADSFFLPGSYPESTPADSEARSILVLRERDGVLFIGNGDWRTNRGPVWLWSWSPGEAPKRRLHLAEEAIEVIRVIDGRIHVPGIDSIEPWDYGTLYVEHKTGWSKHRTIKRALHVFDVLKHGGRLYVGVGTDLGGALYESKDRGMTWRVVFESADSFRIWALGVVEDKLVAFPSDAKRGPWILRGNRVERKEMDLLPGVTFPNPAEEDGVIFWRQNVHRVESFGSGLLYTVHPGSQRRKHDGLPTRPLFSLPSLESGPLLVEEYARRTVSDIKVIRNTAWVLDVSEEDGRYRARIKGSRDLRRWFLAYEGSFDAYPNAFAAVGDRLVIGLAAPDPNVYSANSGQLVTEALPDVMRLSR